VQNNKIETKDFMNVHMIKLKMLHYTLIHLMSLQSLQMNNQIP
jgi:hypothetical protein